MATGRLTQPYNHSTIDRERLNRPVNGERNTSMAATARQNAAAAWSWATVMEPERTGVRSLNGGLSPARPRPTRPAARCGGASESGWSERMVRSTRWSSDQPDKCRKSEYEPRRSAGSGETTDRHQGPASEPCCSMSSSRSAAAACRCERPASSTPFSGAMSPAFASATSH